MNTPEHGWVGPAEPQVFEVSFGTRGPFGMGGTPDPVLGWLGKGEARIDANGLRLSGSKRALARNDLESIELPPESMRNVSGRDDLVRFQARLPDKGLVWIGMRTAGVEQSRRIVELLPGWYTEEFTAQLAELKDFHERINAATQPPIVTQAIVALCVLVFVAMAIGGAGVVVPDGEVAVRWGSNYGPVTLGGEWWRLLTSCFIHFGIIHLALNMYALWETGQTTERLFGRGRFLALYLFAGLTGSLASMIWNPIINGAGASGAIFGVFGGLLAFTLDKRNRVPVAVMTEHRNSTLLFAGYSLFYGAVHPNIDNAAHLGGLAGGFLMGLLLARPVDVSARARAGAARLWLSAGVGVLVLGAMFAAASHPRAEVGARLAYQRYLETFNERENRALALAQHAFEQAKTDDAAAVRLMSEASTEFRRLHDEAGAFALDAGSKEAAQRAKLQRYTQARARHLDLISRYGKDPAATDAAIDAADAEAKAALEALK